MGISVFLHQIPLWAELCEVLAEMSDKEIHDLLNTAWDYGTHIAWHDSDDADDDDDASTMGGVARFIPWNRNAEKDENTDQNNANMHSAERFSAALRCIHDKKRKGEYGDDAEYSDRYLELAQAMDEAAAAA